MTVNLRNELNSARKKLTGNEDILGAVSAILLDNERQPAAIKETLKKGKKLKVNLMRFDLLETDRIFHISHIKKVCIDYRLRFLDSTLFKQGIPEEAVTQIRLLEQAHQTSIGGFKIAAPTKTFKLLNYNDPMLFAPLGNGYYYLVHQWGTDMKSMRKWLVLPFRNIGYFTAACAILSLLLTLMIPHSKLSERVPMASIIIFLFLFKSIFAIFLYSFFMGGRKFNAQMWNSRYYNN